MNSSDSQTLTCSSYFEVTGRQLEAAANGRISYSIRCDPFTGVIQLDNGSSGYALHSVGLVQGPGDASGSPQSIAEVSRVNQFATLFREYKLNSLNVRILCDQNSFGCPVFAATDRADAIPLSSVSQVMGQKHISLCLHAAKRELSYSWRPIGAVEGSYHTIADGCAQQNVHYLKIFQDIENSVLNAESTHRVQLTWNVTLRDSKAATGNF